MLLELAIGDAYGKGFEFADQTILETRVNDGGRYYPHPFHVIPSNCYTDDTQMSIAVAEVILAKGNSASKMDFADAFVSAYHRDNRLGYSSRCQMILGAVTDGAGLYHSLNRISIGAGAAMRAVPIGYITDLHDVKIIALEQASVTHDTVSGKMAAIAVAYMSHYAIYKLGSKEQMRAWLRSMFGVSCRCFDEQHVGNVPNEGIPAVNAALTSIENGDTLSEILRIAVSFGGDVDTVATIAMGIAANLLPRNAHDLCKTLFADLENGSYGRDYLASLDWKLKQRFEK